MQTIIWALGAAAVLFLLMLVIQLGISTKGKVIIVVSCLVLGLGSSYAAEVFLMWQTALILVLLVLIASYFISTRMGAVLLTTKIEMVEDINVKAEEAFHSVGNELPSISEPVVLTKKFNTTEAKNDEGLNNTIAFPQSSSSTLIEPEALEDDISFLLERLQEPEPEKTDTNVIEETGYLEDIENLLFSEDVEVSSKITEVHDEPISAEIEVKEINLEDLILAVKEAAPTSEDDVLEKIDFRKKD